MNTLINEIFDNYYAPIKLPDNNREGLKSALLQAIMECRPKEWYPTADPESLVHIRADGHNEAIKEWENNIKALFGENKE